MVVHCQVTVNRFDVVATDWYYGPSLVVVQLPDSVALSWPMTPEGQERQRLRWNWAGEVQLLSLRLVEGVVSSAHQWSGSFQSWIKQNSANQIARLNSFAPMQQRAGLRWWLDLDHWMQMRFLVENGTSRRSGDSGRLMTFLNTPKNIAYMVWLSNVYILVGVARTLSLKSKHFKLSVLHFLNNKALNSSVYWFMIPRLITLIQ